MSNLEEVQIYSQDIASGNSDFSISESTIDNIKQLEKSEPKELTLFPIVKYGNPALHKISEDADLDTEETHSLIQLLRKHLYFYEAFGISAVQIGVHKNIFLVRNLNSELVVINPKTLDTQGRKVEYEGCLSFPTIEIPVERAERVTLEYTEPLHWERKTDEFDGIIARAIQHEISHLLGQTFLDLVSPLKRKLVLEKIAKLKKKDKRGISKWDMDIYAISQMQKMLAKKEND